MKHALNKSLIALSLIISIACDAIQRGPEQLSEDDYTTVTVTDNYKIDIPSYMSEGELHEDASLEYQHLFKETYTIIIDENKAEADEIISYYDTYDTEDSFMQNYINFQKDSFDDGSDVVTMGTIKDLNINGLKVKQFDMVLDLPDLDEHIAYLVTFYESHESIYMLMSWTLEGRMNRYRSTFETIANSFQIQKRRSKTKRS